MLFTIDLDTLELIASATDRRRVSMVEAKRGDGMPATLAFFSGGTQGPLEASTDIAFGAKESGAYADEAIVFLEGFSVSGSGETTTYQGSPSLNGIELKRLLVNGEIGEIVADTAARYALTDKSIGYIVEQTDTAKFWIVTDADELDNSAGWEPAPEKNYVDLIAEITWHQPSDDEPQTTRTFTLRIHNDVVRGDEATPAAVAEPDDEWVAHGHAQTLTLAQKTQALQNIGADRKFVAKTVSEQVPTSSINILAGLRYQFVEVTSSAEVDPGATSQKLGLPVTDVLPGDVIEIRLKTLSTTPANLPLNLYTRNPGPGTWTTLLASLRNVGDSIRLTCLTASASVTTWMIEPFLPRYASLSAANAGEADIGIIFWDTTLLRQRVTTATS